MDTKELLKKAAKTIERLGAAAQDCKSCKKMPLCNAYRTEDIFEGCDYEWLYADKVAKQD